MGACCTKASNKTPIKAVSERGATLIQTGGGYPPTEVVKYKAKVRIFLYPKTGTPITLDQINKSIEEWMELTKRRKPKVDDSSTERLDDEEKDDVIDDKEYFNLAELSKNKQSNEEINKEIIDDFYNFNKRPQHFSEISSTIHFTALNSKDLAISKYKMVSGGLNLHYSKSISIVNVLDELNNDKTAKPATGLNKNMTNVSLLEDAKIMPKSQRNNATFNNHSQTQLNNVNINSYFNRTQSIQLNTVDFNSNDNNDALIHSESLSTQNDFVIENIYHNVEKLTTDKLITPVNSEFLIKQTSYINGLYTPALLGQDDLKGSSSVITAYPEEFDGLKIEWKRGIYSRPPKFPDGKSISQGIANNCSLIAAVLSILNYDRLFSKTKLYNIFYPYKDNVAPTYNKEGYYRLKLFFNGAARLLDIDDLLPYSKNSPVFTKGDNYWINLIEKAIYMLYNSESFALKSNPSFEIYHLIGWIPEICLLDNMNGKPNLWNRIHTNFNEGNILLCLGTGNKDLHSHEHSSNHTVGKFNIVNDHSYIVLEVFEEMDIKLLKCKNPWGHTIPTCIHEKTTNEDKENGCFWIEWDNVPKYFSYLFISFNPDIYSYKYTYTSTWKNFTAPSKFYDENYSLEYNPQYVITIPEHKEDFEMRILLTRYSKVLSNKPRKSISYKLYWFEGYPAIYPTESLRTLNNPCREVSSDVFIFSASSQVDQFVLVILKQDHDDEDDTLYTVELFSYLNVLIQEMPRRNILNTKGFKCIDNWCLSKPGGNLLSPSLVNNPQFRISLKSLQCVQIKLETSLTTPIMIVVIEGGKHIGHSTFDEVISNKNPGFYYNSFSYFECVLDRGEYTIICVSQEERIVSIGDLTNLD
jgi:hypothetical protein